MSEMLKELIRNVPLTTTSHYYLERFALDLFQPSITRLRGTATADAYEVGKQWHNGYASYLELRNAYHRAWRAKNDEANADGFTRYMSRAVAIMLGWMHSSAFAPDINQYNYILARLAYLVAKAAADGDELLLTDIEHKQVELFRSIITPELLKTF